MLDTTIVHECRKVQHYRASELKTRLSELLPFGILKLLSSSAIKFIATREIRQLRQQEEIVKRSKTAAKSIAQSVRSFWKMIETLVVQRQQAALQMELRVQKEAHEQELLTAASEFAEAIASGLRDWETGLDPRMLVTSKTSLFETQDGDIIFPVTRRNRTYFIDSKKRPVPLTRSKGETELNPNCEETVSSSPAKVSRSDTSDSLTDADPDAELLLLKQEAEMSLDDLKRTFGLDTSEEEKDKSEAVSGKKKKKGTKDRVSNSMQCKKPLTGVSQGPPPKKKKRTKAHIAPTPVQGGSNSDDGEDDQHTAHPVLEERPRILLTPTLCPLPFLLRATLRTYQHEGLTWLLTLHDKKANGILADEMGLGKTIQTIALLAYLACYRGIWGPHLIVAPGSVLLNWEMEFHRFLPGFKVLTYYGGRKEREKRRQGWSDARMFNVCIVSYSIVVADAHIFRRKPWYFMVLDEAQHIKNYQSQKWQTLLHFNCQRRLLLTGTPLQNDLIELWSLMHFLMPDLFQSHSYWKELFSDPLTQAIEASSVQQEQSLVSRLHGILRPFLLRRLKRDVESQMPSKYEHVLRCTLTQRQRLLYNEFIQRPSTREKLESSDYFGLLNVLLQLRKICNHPDLLSPREISTPVTSFRAIPFTVPKLTHLGLAEPWINSPDTLLSRLNPYSGLTSLADSELSDMGFPIYTNRPHDSNHSRPPFLDTARFPLHVQRSQPLNVHTPPTSVVQSTWIQEMDSSFAGTNPSPLSLDSHPCASCDGLLFILFGSSGLDDFKVNITPNDGFTTDSIKQRSSDPSSSCSSLSKMEGLKLTPTIKAITDQQNYHMGLAHAFSRRGSTCQPFNPVHFCFHNHPTHLVNHPLLIDAPGNSNLKSFISCDEELTMCPLVDRLTNAFSSGSRQVEWIDAAFSRLRSTSASQRHTDQKKATETQPTPENSFSLYKQSLLNACRSMGIDLKDVPSTDPKWLASKWAKLLANLSSVLLRSTTLNCLVQDDVFGYFPSSNGSSQWSNWINGVKRLSSWESKHVMRRTPLNCWLGKSFRQWLIHEIWHDAPWSPHTFLHSPNHHCCWNHLMDPHLQELCVNPLERVLRNPFFFFLICTHPFNILVNTKELFLHGRPLYGFENATRTEPVREFFIEMSASYSSICVTQRCVLPSKMTIQHDCGKMILLATLLRKFKSEGHKCILFTQMSKMLDLLEIFLNIHGYTYVRLDGSTSINQRQRLVECFNNDSRIFIFMASTRAGGMGMNLTGADTVIFYDTDWNPAMDRQAMDRCHRIGQIRDVHVYRLITEFTIEESILRKQLFKRALDDIVVDQGRFTTQHLSKAMTHADVKEMFISSSDTQDLYVTRVLHESKNTTQDTMTPAEPLGFFEHAITEVEKMETDLQEGIHTYTFYEDKLCERSDSPKSDSKAHPDSFSNSSAPEAHDHLGQSTEDQSELCLIHLNSKTSIYVTQLIRAAIYFLEESPSLSTLNETAQLKQKWTPKKY